MRYFEPTSITCLLEPWLRELGFSIFYGSILIKLYRILTEFQTRKAHRVCFRDKDQIVYLLAIVLIVVGYMSAWTALMVDGFFFSRQNSQTSVTNSQTHNSASDTNDIAQMASSLSLQTAGSSHHYFERQPNSLKHQLSSHDELINQNFLLANSVEEEEEQQRRQRSETNLRYRRYLNRFARESVLNEQTQNRIGIVRETELVTSRGGNLSFIDKSTNNDRRHNLAKLDRKDRLKTSNFHYIEPEFALLRSVSTSQPNSNFNSEFRSESESEFGSEFEFESESNSKPDSASHFRISNESDSSSTLLNNSVNGSKDRNKETFFVAKNRTLDETNNFKQQQQQQQPSSRFNINSNYDNNNFYNFYNPTKGPGLLLNGNSSSISAAFEDVGQFSSWAPSLGELFAQNLNSFSDLFSSLLESERQYDEFNDLLTYSMRCRKLTWDYVTELSKLI